MKTIPFFLCILLGLVFLPMNQLQAEDVPKSQVETSDQAIYKIKAPMRDVMDMTGIRSIMIPWNHSNDACHFKGVRVYYKENP